MRSSRDVRAVLEKPAPVEERFLKLAGVPEPDPGEVLLRLRRKPQPAPLRPHPAN